MDYQNDKLPCEILFIIFSFLVIDDLVTVQRVCHLWRLVAQNKSLWKSYEHKLNSKLHYFRPQREIDIRIMPAVRNLCGHAKNDFLDVILKNVIELNKLNVKFQPPLTSLQIQSVLKTYPKIEVIGLGLRATDILDSMKILKTSGYIKKVVFHFDHSQYPNVSDMLIKLIDLFTVFTESSSFAALKEIDLRFMPLRTALEDEIFSGILADILKMRSHQLLSLNLRLFHPYNANILKSLSECVKLTDLDIGLFNNQLTDVDIVRMSELKSLELRFQDSDSPCKQSDYFSKGSWKYLTKVSFTVEPNDTFRGTVLRAIIENVKNLKELYYEDLNCITNEDELDQVYTLLSLVSLCVTYLKNLTERGISCVSNCTKITRLELQATMSDTDIQEDYVRNELQRLVKVKRCKIFVPDQVDIQFGNE